jgi:hypothetical protein
MDAVGLNREADLAQGFLQAAGRIGIVSTVYVENAHVINGSL